MIVNFEMIIFELLRLYYELTEENTINIKDLENAFNEIINFLNQDDEYNITFDFNQELNNFIDIYADYLITTSDNITFDGENLDNLYTDITANIEYLTEEDYNLSTYVINYKIVEALNITIPYENTEEIFELNKNYMATLFKLGMNEIKGQIDYSLLTNLKYYYQTLKQTINNLDDQEFLYLQIALSKYHENNLLEDGSNFNNSPWYIALFSENPNQIKSLFYNLTYELVSNYDDEVEEEPEEVEYFNEFSFDLPLFLNYFMAYLNDYIANETNHQIKENLLTKKYLLLGSDDLKYTKDILINEGSLDNMPLPEIPTEWLTKYSFDFMFNIAIKCATNINNYPDLKITKKPYLMTKIIINCLFIKTFIKLNCNQENTENIINIILNNKYYNNPEFNAANNFINNLIFKDYQSLSR